MAPSPAITSYHHRNPARCERTGKVVSGKQKSIHDGPYAEAKDIVNGFTLIEAHDLPHAVEISKGCPILEAGGTVEVRPVRVLNM